MSVFGDERGKEVALAGLKSKAKYVRSELGKRMKLRLTPEIRFLEDEALERGSRVSILVFFTYHSHAFSKVESPLIIKHFYLPFCNFFSSLLLICPHNDAQNTRTFTGIHFCGFDFIFVCITYVWFGDLIT